MDKKRKENLQYFFKPRSIGIVGASSDPLKVSGRPLFNLVRLKYPGKIYPINPKYREIAGVPCYPTLKDVPGDIDLIMVIVSSEDVLPNLELGLEKGVKVAAIISGGFAEIGGKGLELQDEMTAFAQKTGMLVYGPNTNGCISLVHRTYATFSQSLEGVEDLIPGKVGLITQSGAFGAVIFSRAMRVGLRFSHWAATGNEADLEFCDFLEYMAEDPHTEVITGFMAGVKDGQRLIHGLEMAAQKGKPVVILKVGGTRPGQKAAFYHTGAIVGSARAYDAVFKEFGVILARDIDQFLDFAKALTTLPLPRGRRVGILTESGGGGVLITERFSELGMDVVDIVGKTREKLREVIPAIGSIENPVDLTGHGLSNPALLKASLEVMLESEDFDMVVALLLMSEATAKIRARDLLELHKRHKGQKVLDVCWPEGPRELIKSLMEEGVHISVTPARSVHILKALTYYSEFKRQYKPLKPLNKAKIQGLPSDRREKALKVIQESMAEGRKTLNDHDAERVLQAYGIPITREALARSKDEAMVVETIVGVSLEEPFGAAIHFGIGGIIGELLQEVGVRVLPVNEEDLEGMIREIRGYKLLQGIMGRPPADVKALMNVLLKMSCLAEELKETVRDIRLHPFLVFQEGKGVKAIDALITLHDDDN